MKLLDILKELISTDHYIERKIDRVINIKQINVSKEALGDFTLSQIQKPLIKEIQNIILNKLKNLELKDFPLSQAYYIGYKFFTPVLENNNKQYPITITTDKGTGTYYYIIIYDEKLITVVVSDSDNFEQDIPKHLKRKKIDVPVKTITSIDAIYPINLNKLMGIKAPKPEKVAEKDLPYKVRTDYRIGANFEHKIYGTGKIVATSSGTGGKADQRGMLAWVEVDFGKPYLSGGKVLKTRKIYNVYAKPYFDTTDVLE